MIQIHETERYVYVVQGTKLIQCGDRVELHCFDESIKSGEVIFSSTGIQGNYITIEYDENYYDDDGLEDLKYELIG